MAAEKAANPPHPNTPAFSPARSHTHKNKECFIKIPIKTYKCSSEREGMEILTTESYDSPGDTATVDCILPVRLSPVL